MPARSLSRNPWVRLSIVFLIAFLLRVASAEPAANKPVPAKKKTVASKTTTTSHTTVAKSTVARKARSNENRNPASESGSLHESAQAKGGLPIELQTGPGLIVGNGFTGFNLEVGAITPVTHKYPIYVGIESGLNIWSVSVGNPFLGTSQSYTTVALPLLATGIWRFELPGNPTLHPFAGLAMGPSIYFGSANSGVNFELLFRGGLGIDVAPKVAVLVEPKMGILAGSFIFAPTVLGSFNL